MANRKRHMCAVSCRVISWLMQYFIPKNKKENVPNKLKMEIFSVCKIARFREIWASMQFLNESMQQFNESTALAELKGVGSIKIYGHSLGWTHRMGFGALQNCFVYAAFPFQYINDQYGYNAACDTSYLIQTG